MEKMEKRCRGTALLRLGIFGIQTARSLMLMNMSSCATTSEGIRRILFETWTLMWFFLEIDDGEKLEKWFENPNEALHERSDKVRTKLEEYIHSKYGEWTEFRDYYDGASVVGIHPSYESTTNAMAESTARLGFADREAVENLAQQQSVAFGELKFHVFCLVSSIVATFDTTDELKDMRVPLNKTRGWIKEWEAERAA